MNAFSQKVINMLPETVFAPRTVASAKPQILHRIILEASTEFEKPRKRFLEVYGRVNNLESGWITAGFQAKDFSLL